MLFSTATNIDTSFVVSHQAHAIKPILKNRGEIYSQELCLVVIHCETDITNDTICCETAINAINTTNLVLLWAMSHSHHFFYYFNAHIVL